jgi:hypothetical protein
MGPQAAAHDSARAASSLRRFSSISIDQIARRRQSRNGPTSLPSQEVSSDSAFHELAARVSIMSAIHPGPSETARPDATHCGHLRSSGINGHKKLVRQKPVEKPE